MRTEADGNNFRVAIACPGLEHTLRGFETFAMELFNAVSKLGDVHLIKGTGKNGERIHRARCLLRTNPLFGMMPTRLMTEYRRFAIECQTFACGMLPILFREKFDVIHFSEVPLGIALQGIRQRFGFKYKLILSNGAPWPASDCMRFEYVQQVSPQHDQYCRDAGLPESARFFIPYGCDGERLISKSSGKAIREYYGIPDNAKVVLSLAALNCHHKRIDWLVKEFAKLVRNDAFLLLAGNRQHETARIESLAKELLPSDKYRLMQVPYEDVPDLLVAADVMVQCSLNEGFGRVLTEAMGAGVPLLVHPHETARWIVDCKDCHVDMTIEGELADRLDKLLSDDQLVAEIVSVNEQSFKRFSWPHLAPQYMLMYETVCKYGRDVDAKFAVVETDED